MCNFSINFVFYRICAENMGVTISGFDYSTHALIYRFCNFLLHFRKNTAKNTTKAGNSP